MSPNQPSVTYVSACFQCFRAITILLQYIILSDSLSSIGWKIFSKDFFPWLSFSIYQCILNFKDKDISTLLKFQIDLGIKALTFSKS